MIEKDKLQSKWLEYSHTMKENEYHTALNEGEIKRAEKQLDDLLELLEWRKYEGQLSRKEVEETVSMYRTAYLLATVEEIVVIGQAVMSFERRHGGWLLIDASSQEGIKFYSDDVFVKKLVEKYRKTLRTANGKAVIAK